MIRERKYMICICPPVFIERKKETRINRKDVNITASGMINSGILSPFVILSGSVSSSVNHDTVTQPVYIVVVVGDDYHLRNFS